ncbi:MAG: hypothetical protein PHW33_00115 [Candidatus Portnoybacteria bacterium]|nr:hypothetical protein [Candidatus Portnoybacteria bacterium]
MTWVYIGSAAIVVFGVIWWLASKDNGSGQTPSDKPPAENFPPPPQAPQA